MMEDNFIRPLSEDMGCENLRYCSKCKTLYNINKGSGCYRCDPSKKYKTNKKIKSKK